MKFDTYVIVLCLIVLVAISVFFSVLMFAIVKMNIKMIDGGLLDSEIQAEYEKYNKRKKKMLLIILGRIILSIVCFLLFAMFIFSMVLRIEEKNALLPKVVNSNSMSCKSEKNAYLYENELNDQIKRFDIIFLSEMPKDTDIKLYDIVAYETVEGFLIIHRIIGISEESDKRTYILRGDANPYSDPIEIIYYQMKGIYKGKRIAHIGSFIIFLQTPVGWLCIISIVFCTIALPIVRRKIQKAVDKRILIIYPEKE